MKKIISLIVLLFAGCAFLEEPQPITSIEQNTQVTNNNVSNNTSSEPEIIIGGTVDISMRNPTSLNPIINTDPTVAYMLGFIYEPLFEFVNLSPEPVLASALLPTEDYSSAIVTLRNRFWSDGTQVTANDVLFSFNQIRANPTSLYHHVIENISSVTVENNQTLRFNFNRPMGGRIEHSLVFPIIPFHHFSGQMSQLTPIGSGSFMLQNSNLPREMIFTQNPFHPNSPYINSIRVNIMPDRETDFHALNRGRINVLPATTADIEKFGISTVNMNVASFPTNNLDFLAFNFNNPILNNVLIRRAIAHAMLETDFIYPTYQRQAVRTSSIAHPKSPFYLNGLNYHNFNLATSQELFEQAGFTQISDGVMGIVVSYVPIPLSLRILVNEESTERVAMANFLRQNLENMGIYVNFIELDFYSYKNEIEARNFDLLFVGSNIPLDPSPFIHSNGAYNFMNFENQSLDYYVTSMRNSTTTVDYKKYWQNIQRYINNELPLIPIAFRNEVVLTTQNIVVGGQPSLSNVYRSISDWSFRN